MFFKIKFHIFKFNKIRLINLRLSFCKTSIEKAPEPIRCNRVILLPKGGALEPENKSDMFIVNRNVFII